jgi:hypothetical protein
MRRRCCIILEDGFVVFPYIFSLLHPLTALYLSAAWRSDSRTGITACLPSILLQCRVAHWNHGDHISELFGRRHVDTKHEAIVRYLG